MQRVGGPAKKAPDMTEQAIWQFWGGAATTVAI
jgi:hypothetical protein